jgi:hypothetical protein
VTLTFDLWPWKSIGFQILLRTKYVPSLVKIHWRMLILECSQGCYGRTEGPLNYLKIWLRVFWWRSLQKHVVPNIRYLRCNKGHQQVWMFQISFNRFIPDLFLSVELYFGGGVGMVAVGNAVYCLFFIVNLFTFNYMYSNR